MKKTFAILSVLCFFGNTSIFAQTGRPEPISNGAPKITARNSLDKDVTTLSEKFSDLEKRMAAIEAENAGLKSDNAALKSDNAALKAENNSQQKQINDQSTAINLNYKILENYINSVKAKFDNQVGTFRITGGISNKSLGTSGSVTLLMGTHE